jgi:hypothetical protein
MGGNCASACTGSTADKSARKSSILLVSGASTEKKGHGNARRDLSFFHISPSDGKLPLHMPRNRPFVK